MDAGKTLKDIRNRLALSIREVEKRSSEIAQRESNREFHISNAFLSQLEKGVSTPSIYKLLSLSTIYRANYHDLLRLFGVKLENINLHQLTEGSPDTHLLNLELYGKEQLVSFPVKFDPGFQPEKTALLSRMVEVWGEVPIAVLQHLNLREVKYGFIGLEDFTLNPLIRPGSFVQIDDETRRYRKVPWRTEYDRPIYFVELRDGYACSWCELQGSTLTLVPHPLSGCKIRQFTYPRDAEIVGRVTGVAMRLVDSSEQARDGTAQLAGHT